MISTRLRIFFFCALCIVVSVSSLQAQAVVLLKGKILDNASGKKVDLTFQDPSGKSVRASSSTEGIYQTVLKSATHYAVTIDDDNFQKFTFQVDTPKSEKYSEMTQDFSLKAPLPPTDDSQVAKKTKKKTKAKKSTKGK